MEWQNFNTMEGEGSKAGQWKILRRRGDDTFNIFRDSMLVALGFPNRSSAQIYVEKTNAQPESD